MTILTSTNYITVPLTTTFTPPIQCVETTFTLSAANGYDQWPAPGGTLFRGADPSCFPDGFGAATTTASTSSGGTETFDFGGTTGISLSPLIVVNYWETFFSPATICPKYYSTIDGLSVSSGTTTATCCPALRSTTYDTINGASNIFSTSGSFTGQSAICWGDFLESAVIILSEGTTTTLSTQYPAITASAILIAWQSSDILSTSTSASPGSTITSVSSPTTSSAPTASTSAPAPGLSTGAKAGIGVGAAIGGIALLALAGFFFLRRRKPQKPQAAEDDTVGGKAELPGEGRERPELSAEQTVYEKYGNSMPPEADGGNVLAELDGNWHGHEIAAQKGGVNAAQHPVASSRE